MHDVVFYHQSLPHPLRPALGTAGDAMDAAAMLRLCVASVARSMPDGRPVLITGDDPPIVDGIAVERRILADPAELQLDRTRAYRDYIARRVGAAGGVLFLDTDTLVMGDASRMFDQPFDAALTYREDAAAGPAAPLDRWGLPGGDGPSVLNFGVIGARCTAGAVALFDAALERFDAIVADGRDFLSAGRNVFHAGSVRFRIPDVRTWGGDQFAMTSLLSHMLFGPDRTTRARVAGAEILLLPSSRWNYTPPDDLARADFSGCSVAHFKGLKKHWMRIVAHRHGIVAPQRGPPSSSKMGS